MGAYCSNSEQDTSKALRQVQREIKTQKMITTEVMYEIVYAVANLHLVLIQKEGTLMFTTVIVKTIAARSSHRRCSVRKGALTNFAKFTEKRL